MKLFKIITYTVGATVSSGMVVHSWHEWGIVIPWVVCMLLYIQLASNACKEGK